MLQLPAMPWRNGSLPLTRARHGTCLSNERFHAAQSGANIAFAGRVGQAQEAFAIGAEALALKATPAIKQGAGQIAESQPVPLMLEMQDARGLRQVPLDGVKPLDNDIARVSKLCRNLDFILGPGGKARHLGCTLVHE
jgi:hypothetical protein